MRKVALSAKLSLTLGDYIGLGVSPAWCSFIADTKGHFEELKTLDALKVVLANVVVDRVEHYQGLVRLYHMRVVHESRNCEVGGAAASVSADVPLPVGMIDVGAEWVRLYLDEDCDPRAVKKVMVLLREEYLLTRVPDLTAAAKCDGCGQLFDGLARIDHLREPGPCLDAVISSIKDEDLFYCDGSCENLDCKRMECCDVKWPFLSAAACDLHKDHANGNQHEIRLRDIRTMEACDVECICHPERCQKTSCPLNLFARQVRDKIKKERPPCTCNKSSHHRDCKRTCPKLQFMIENKFCRKENPFRSHFGRFERGV